MHKVLTYFGLKLCITVNSSPVYWRIQQDIKLQWLHSFGEINIDDWLIFKTRIRSRITSPILRMHMMHRIKQAFRTNIQWKNTIPTSELDIRFHNTTLHLSCQFLKQCLCYFISLCLNIYIRHIISNLAILIITNKDNAKILLCFHVHDVRTINLWKIHLLNFVKEVGIRGVYIHWGFKLLHNVKPCLYRLDTGV